MVRAEPTARGNWQGIQRNAGGQGKHASDSVSLCDAEGCAAEYRLSSKPVWGLIGLQRSVVCNFGASVRTRAEYVRSSCLVVVSALSFIIQVELVLRYDPASKPLADYVRLPRVALSTLSPAYTWFPYPRE